MREECWTSISPPRREIVSSVRMSPMPGNTSLAWNNERKPSACHPQRADACEKILQAGECHDTLAAPFCDERREIVQGGDVGQLVEGEEHGGSRGGSSGTQGSGTLVGGHAQIPQHAGHEGGGVALLVAAGADVERRRGRREGSSVERRAFGASKGSVRTEARQDAGRRRPDAALLPRIGAGDAGEEVEGAVGVMAGERGDEVVALAPVDRLHDTGEGQALEGAGVEGGRQQGRRPLVPVQRLATVAAGPGGQHHRLRHGEGALPLPGGLQGRPGDPFDAGGRRHRPARVVEEAVAHHGSGGRRETEEIGLRRGGDDRAAAPEDVRDHDGGRLAAAGRAEDERAVLGRGEEGAAREASEEDAVGAGLDEGQPAGEGACIELADRRRPSLERSGHGRQFSAALTGLPTVRAPHDVGGRADEGAPCTTSGAHGML